MNHNKKYKSLKVKIDEIEQLVKKLSKKISTNKVKCLLWDWAGRWAKKLKPMHKKGHKSKKGGRRGGKSMRRGGMKSSKRKGGRRG